MLSIEGDLDRLVLYLRAYKYVINDPDNTALYPPGVRSKDELEQNIKTLFISLMGSSAAIREQEEARARIKREEMDQELKKAIKAIINEGVGSNYQTQIKQELAPLREILAQAQKEEGVKDEVKEIVASLKTELQGLREAVNSKSLSSEQIKRILVPYIREGRDNRGSAQGEDMKDEKEVYITYPAKGGKRTIGAGTLEIDFLTGQVSLPNGETENTSLRLDAFGFKTVGSISIDTTKAVTLSLDDSGKYEIEAYQLFGIGNREFRIAYIEATETTEIKIWASTSPRGAVDVVRPTSIDTDERRFTTAIEYDDSGNPIYVGEAESGSGKSDEKWRIKKLIYSGSNVTDIQWAEGSTSFKFAWDDRATYSYS